VKRGILLFLLSPFLFSFKLLDVPFVKQKDDYCGPASLSSVLEYYHIKENQEDIAKAVYNPKLKGALITDLENYAKSLGLEAHTFQGNLEDVKRYIDEGKPVILLVDLGFLWFSVPHYMVVIGYDKKHMYVHTGYESKKAFDYQDLDKKWAKMGRVGLVVYPKAQVVEPSSSR
jgi:ABC-type bacteriocin/lantibiotic exporter with double-glycine peptidase domain